jgi:hypothetical protein
VRSEEEEEQGAVSDLPVEQAEDLEVSVSVPLPMPLAAAEASPAVWMRRREDDRGSDAETAAVAS